MRSLRIHSARIGAAVRAASRLGACVGLVTLLASLPAFGEIVSSETCRQPICVDGVPSETSSCDNPTSFESGSLYTGKYLGQVSPFRNALLSVFLAKDEEDPKGPLACFARWEFRRRTAPFTTSGECVAAIKFPATVNGTRRSNFTILLTAAPGSPAGCTGVVDLLGDGAPYDGPIGNYGIKAAISFAPGYLYGELKVPLLIPKQYGSAFPPQGLPNGILTPAAALWTINAATNQSNASNCVLGQQSSALVSISGTGVTTSNSDHVPVHVTLKVKPNSGKDVASIGAGDVGSLQVAIYTTSIFDARTVNVSTLLIGDPRPGFGRARARKAEVKDVNGDRQPDLLVFFDLTGSGAFDNNTTLLELTGKTLAGYPISDQDAVIVLH